MKNSIKRIAIVGVSASGKSTFARKLSEKTNLPLFLVDSIMWKPGWQYVGDEETVSALKKIIKQDYWIIEGYISKGAQTYLLERADMIVYLDYPRMIATFRYLKRWWKHRKNPRQELKGCPEKFDWNFLVRVWKKVEVVPLNKHLVELNVQNKVIRLTSLRKTRNFVQKI